MKCKSPKKKSWHFPEEPKRSYMWGDNSWIEGDTAGMMSFGWVHTLLASLMTSGLYSGWTYQHLGCATSVTQWALGVSLQNHLCSPQVHERTLPAALSVPGKHRRWRKRLSLRRGLNASRYVRGAMTPPSSMSRKYVCHANMCEIQWLQKGGYKIKRMLYRILQIWRKARPRERIWTEESWGNTSL